MHHTILMLFTFGLTVAFGTPVITLYPGNTGPVGGNLLAGNGVTLGWGVTIQNDNSGYLVIDSVQIGDPSPVGLTSDFTDLLSTWVGNNSYALTPGGSLHLDWILGAQGLGEFSFPSSSFGFSGPLVPMTISYDVFDANPFYDAYTSDVPGSLELDVNLAVTAPPLTAIPEPETCSLVALGLILGWLASRRPRRSRS